MNTLKRRVLAASASSLLVLSLVTPVALAQADTTATTVDKDETVYVYTTPVGSVRNVTVRDLLANEKGDAILTDKSSLRDIKPTSDDTTLSSKKGEALVWDTQGKEVQYKGTTESELPIGVRVSYTLGGKMVAPEQLAGKSGRVTIRIDYTNNAKRTVSVDDEQAEIYTPFVAMSTVSLDRDVFTNVSVTNGRVIDGSGSMSVIGYAMPGLQESLDMDAEDLELPSYVLIEADVTDFSLGSIVTMVTSEVFADMDTTDLDTSELTDARDGLTKAMNELVSGTDELASGMQQLADGQQELTGGLRQLSQMTSGLPATTGALAQGASDLKAGIGTAKTGADKLAGGAASVADGVAQARGLADAAAGSAGAVAGDLVALQGGIDATKESLNTQIEALGQFKDKLSNEGDKTAYEAVINALKTARESIPSTEAAQNDAATTAMTLGKAQYALGLTADGAAGVRDGAQGLASGLGELTSGASQLAQGISTFSGAMPQLAQGVSSLAQGADQLATATSAAAQGTSALASGVQTFNEDGIKELVDKLDESGIASIGSRLEALSDAADSYQTFSGLADGQTGAVKFIIRTDAIGQ